TPVPEGTDEPIAAGDADAVPLRLADVERPVGTEHQPFHVFQRGVARRDAVSRVAAPAGHPSDEARRIDAPDLGKIAEVHGAVRADGQGEDAPRDARRTGRLAILREPGLAAHVPRDVRDAAARSHPADGPDAADVDAAVRPDAHAPRAVELG